MPRNVLDCAVYSPPTSIVWPSAALAGVARPMAFATNAAAPPRDAARMARRERGRGVSTLISDLPPDARKATRDGRPPRSAHLAGTARPHTSRLVARAHRRRTTWRLAELRPRVARCDHLDPAGQLRVRGSGSERG